MYSINHNLLKSMRKSSFISLLLFSSITLGTTAATKWVNPMDAGYPVVQNQGWTKGLSNTYHRLPDKAQESVRKPLWDLSTNSSGLALYFTTDAPSISIRYTVNGPQSMPHMPATGVSGVDLYRISTDGYTHEFCFSNYSFGDTITYFYKNLQTQNYEGLQDEYRLNLPLYNTVTNLEIGIPDNCTIHFLPRREDKPIVVYGTSIAQGACSSRPGMAWGNIVRRNLNDYPLVNLGFSGNGRLEPELISLLNEIDASIYVIDCLPNLIYRSDEELYNLVSDAVMSLRANSSTPILLVEHAGYSNSLTDPEMMELYINANISQRRAFDDLQAAGTPNLYYLTHDEINFSPDAWVDYVHPSDLGAQQQADAVTSKIKAIVPYIGQQKND